MDDAHGRIGLVDVLSAGTARTHGLDLQIIHVDLEILFFDLRRHQHGCRRRVDAPLALGLRHTLHTVAARLKFQPAIHAVSADLAGYQGESAGIALIHLDRLHAPSSGLGVFGIHAEQISGKDVAFVAAGRAAHFQKSIVRIVRVFGDEEHFQLLQQLFLLRLQFLDLHPGHLPHFLVFLMQQRLRLFQRL